MILAYLSKQRPRGFWLGSSITHNPNHTVQYLLQVLRKTEKRKCQNSETQSCSPHAAPPYSAALLFCGLMLRVSGVPALVDIGLALKTTIYFFSERYWMSGIRTLKCFSTNNKVRRLRYSNHPIVLAQCCSTELWTSFFLQEPQKKSQHHAVVREGFKPQANINVRPLQLHSWFQGAKQRGKNEKSNDR